MDFSGYNIVGRLTPPNHSDFYERNFGKDPGYWEKASPFYALTGEISPFLAVCTTQNDVTCVETEKFLQKIRGLGGYGEILPIDLSHMEINSELGKAGCYTNAVDSFFKKLSPAVASRLIGSDIQAQNSCTNE